MRNKFKLLIIAILSLICLFIFSGVYMSSQEMDFNSMSIQELETYNVTITTKFGDIELEFFPAVAPNHVKSFLTLAHTKFYDNTSFHRVIPGFVIQGGDPNSKDDDPTNDGTGGPGYNINAEFSDIPHERGILSMARSSDPNSAGSQFFIMHKAAPHLDNNYSVFGKVVKGIEIVDEIAMVETNLKDRPIEDVRITMKVFKVE